MGVDTSPSLLSGFAFNLLGAAQHLYVAASAGPPPNPWRILAVGFAAAVSAVPLQGTALAASRSMVSDFPTRTLN